MDEHRKEIKFKFICSECGNELTIRADAKMQCNSAFEINVKIKVVPCDRCKSKHDTITNAIKVLIASATNAI